MEKVFIYALVCILNLVLFSSCNHEEDIQYSCNERINEWVASHLDEVQKMDRNAWKRIPEDMQRPVFVGFTPSQKQKFWLGKLSEIEKMEWNKEEMLHLGKLRAAILKNSQWFVPNISEDVEDEIHLFCSIWVDDAKKKLGWTDDLLGSILLEGNSLKDKLGNVEKSNLQSNLTTRSRSRVRDCHCNMKHSFCGGFGGNEACRGVECDGSTAGCGWLLLNDCNGICDKFVFEEVPDQPGLAT